MKDDIVAFLEAEKRLAKGVLWKPKKSRNDYVYCQIVTVVIDGSLENGLLYLTAHTHRIPNKYGFNIRWRDQDVLRLDVDPGCTHLNASTATRIRGTHWHRWIDGEAEADDRELNHEEWLKEFLKRTGICDKIKYVPPPFDAEQLEMF